MNALIPKTIASLLLLAGAAGAVCAHAQGAPGAASPGGPVTTELPAPPLRLSEQPRIRSAVIAMVGYARGSYTEADTLIAQQVLEGMRSRHDITRTVWPDGRKVIASVNGGDHGEERAAMLLDAEGRLVALGLVNGHCNVPPTGDKPKVCKPAPRCKEGGCRAAVRVGQDAAGVPGSHGRQRRPGKGGGRAEDRERRIHRRPA